jgi:hypothetical protein
MNLYPNPNNGVFNLELSAIQEDVVNITIINQVGAVVFQRENLNIRGTEKLNIDIGNSAPGIYQLFIKGKNSMVSRKIITN